MEMKDFAAIVSKWKTVRHLHFSGVHLYNGFREDLAQSFLALANGPCELEVFICGQISMGEDEEIVFPSSLQWPSWQPLDSDGGIEDADDWIEVQVGGSIHWKGTADIAWVMKEMASYLQSL